MNRLFMKLCSLVLTLVLLGQMLPVPVRSQLPAAESAPSAAPEEGETPAIVGEIFSRRSEYGKEYLLSNGLCLASVHADAVHYEKNGQWQEIDNTLKPFATLESSGYTNTAGPWAVMFPSTLSPSQPVTVAKDGYTLRFYLSGQLKTASDVSLMASGAEEPLALEAAGAANAQPQAIDLTSEKAAAQFPELVSEKLHSRLLYPQVMENTAILYDLISNRVKESILITAPQEALRGYRYTLETGAMIPVLQESGEILLYNETKEKVIMVMPAPYLLDAAGAYCGDVAVSLTGSDGTYTLTYRLPTTWMADAERRYPVVLDPVVEADILQQNIRDRTVGSLKDDKDNNGGSLRCGTNSQYGIQRAFLKFAQLPALSSGDVIVSANIRLTLLRKTSSINTISVHKVLGTWESETLLYENAPDFDPTIEDYARVDTESGRSDGLVFYAWDITDLVQLWYAGENTGMMFKAPDSVENGPSGYEHRFYSSDYDPTNSAAMPQLTILFRNNTGLEPYWDNTSASAGRAGTGYVNSFTGNLVFTRGDIGFGGNRMSAAISHIYNANDALSNPFGLGYGWRTNYSQRLYPWTADPSCYVWEDADGTRHYFYPDPSLPGTYRDEDGLALTLTTGNPGDAPYCLQDKSGATSWFDAAGRLVALRNFQQTPSQITIAYEGDSLRIASVTDGAGRVYRFTYADSLLSRIGYYSTGAQELAHVSYLYTAGDLTAFCDQDGKTAALSYTGSHLLSAAQDIDGYRLEYAYSTAQPGKPSRIIQVAEFSGSQPGGQLTLEYAHNQTTFTDHNGNIQILQFNNWGNTLSVQDGEGRAQFAQYATDASPAGKGNQLALASKLQNTVGNILTQGSFESGSPWDGASIASGTAYYGSKSLQLLSADAAAVQGPAFIAQPGESYTFSAWVKTGESAATLGLGDAVSETLAPNSDWKRLEVCYTNTAADAQSVCPSLSVAGAAATYLDCAQIEAAPTASRYNLVENGDFRDTSAWTGNFILATVPSAAPQLDSRVLKFIGDPADEKQLQQIIQISGSAGDTFVLAGWAKGDAAPYLPEDNTREFSLQLLFHNADGSTFSADPIRFNPDVDSSVSWQYASAPLVAPKDYSSLEVRILYHHNVNSVYFDGIQLYKEAFGSSYTYDESGNVISVVDLQKQTTTYEYDANENLTGVTLPTGAKLSYTYDDYHNVLTATTQTGVAYFFAYDTYGNNTSVAIQSNGVALQSSAAYSPDGNRLVSATDATGQVTTYGYNPDTNLLEWVQYPEDTSASRTEYTYDSMYRLARVEADVGSQTLRASYTYENDCLTKLQTNSTAYSFSYGAFALREKVSIGSRTLAEYSYTSRDNYLSALDYGNGDKVEYTYDSQGRVTRETYENGDTVSYKYDNSGALATVTDSASGRTTTYYYDFTDRLMKYVETGDGFNHTVGYEYDNINNLTTLVNTINGHTLESTYTYDEDNRLSTLTQGSSAVAYSYDAFGRNYKQITSHAGAAILQSAYAYSSPGSGRTSGQVTRHTVCTNYAIRNYTYTYDGNGNILSISDGTNTTSYAYDTANQLVRENNQAAGKTTLWTYDNAGNILTRTEYAYTTAENPGTPTATVNYTYGDDSWGDLLTSYDGIAITYDEIGNPLNNGTYSYTWEHGRQLKTLSDGTTTWTYTYDQDGMRTSASNGTVTDLYVYTGGQLTMMRKNGVAMYFAYDADGSPLTLTYGTTALYYVTNLQGDVIGLTNSRGQSVVEYTYDAWGNPLSVTGSLASTLGQYNPLRYRGYVYDTATGLYYLQSRYYNPEIGRFINADGYLSTGQGILGNNMFAYCNNNPMMLIDSSGNWPSWGDALKSLVTATAAVVVTSLAVAAACTVAPAIAAAVGISVSATAATAVASAALTVATATAAAAAVTTATIGVVVAADTAIKEKTANEPYTVYFLQDDHGTVQYVGRVKDSNYQARMNHHLLTKGLTPQYYISGLSYSEARGLEEIGIIECHTLNTLNPKNNQIHGISPRNKRGEAYMQAALRFIENVAEEKLLNILG